MIKKLAFGILPMLFLSGFDLVFRRDYVAEWKPSSWLTYSVSVVYVLLFGYVFWALLRKRLTHRVSFWAVVVAMSALSAVIYIGQYAYYAYFGIMPGVATYQYFIDNTVVSLANATEGISPVMLLGIVAGVLLFLPFWLASHHAWPQAVPQSGGWRARWPWKSGLLLLLLTPVLYHNAALEQGMEMPSVHAVFSAANAVENELLTGEEQRKFMQVGNRIDLPTLQEPMPYNVVFIINESVRADKLSYYGSQRDTTPNVKAFLERHPDTTFQFEHFYSNSTTSRESYPSILTGVHPFESFAKLHTMPLVFEYAKVFPDVYSFLVSSHRYNNNNFRLFIHSDKLDSEYYRELSGKPPTSNQAIDDKWTVEAFRNNLDKVPEGHQFMAVVHMNTTHFPYWAPVKKFPGKHLLDRYENALAYLDSEQAVLFEILESRRMLDDTIVIFTSDHGEAFGEHGAYGHQRLFHEEGCHVPFWMHLPKPLAERYRPILEQARHVLHSNMDIVPTIVDLIGASRSPQVESTVRQLMGQSMVSPEAAQGQPVVVYNGYTATSLKRGFGLADGQFRMLIHPDSRAESGYKFEAYDLKQDPLEKNNLWKQIPVAKRQRWLNDLTGYPELHDDLAAVMKSGGFLPPDRPVATAR